MVLEFGRTWCLNDAWVLAVLVGQMTRPLTFLFVHGVERYLVVSQWLVRRIMHHKAVIRRFIENSGRVIPAKVCLRDACLVDLGRNCHGLGAACLLRSHRAARSEL